jgi:hypothetical protein
LRATPATEITAPRICLRLYPKTAKFSNTWAQAN